MTLPFLLPPIANGIVPVWQGNGFSIGSEHCRVLHYSENNQGWNDDLTYFHEESVSDQHFMDCASRDQAMAELKKNISQHHPAILEIGCSSGYLLKRIKKSFPSALVMGADVVSEPLHKLAESLPNVPLFRFDLTHCPLPDQSVDAVVLLNVLEHIDNDSLAMKQVHRVLKPGGVVIIEVPAGPNLYDVYDKVLMHYRRYSLSMICRLVKEQGFNITKKSHLGFFLFPSFWLVKMRNKKWLATSDEAQRLHVENSIKKTGESKYMHAIMQTELFLGKWLSYPWGIRCLVVCKRD